MGSDGMNGVGMGQVYSVAHPQRGAPGEIIAGPTLPRPHDATHISYGGRRVPGFDAFSLGAAGLPTCDDPPDYNHVQSWCSANGFDPLTCVAVCRQVAIQNYATPAQPISPASVLQAVQGWWAKTYPGVPFPSPQNLPTIPEFTAIQAYLGQLGQMYNTVLANPLPWQWLDPSVSSTDAIAKMLAAMSAVGLLDAGQLPALDLSTVNWGIFSDPNFINGVIGMANVMNRFVTMAASCPQGSMFVTHPELVQSAFAQYAVGSISSPCDVMPAKTGCASDTDCPSGKRCQNGDCVAVQIPECVSGQIGSCVCGPGALNAGAQVSDVSQCRFGGVVTPTCRLDADCASGQRCSNGNCVAAPAEAKKGMSTGAIVAVSAAVVVAGGLGVWAMTR